MAVVGHYECGFLVDHKKSISESVSPLSLSCKEALFALYEPYFRSSANSSLGSKRRKRKKSTKVGPTEEDLEAAAYHSKVRETIAAGTEKLVQIGVDMGYFLSGNNHVEQNALVSAVPEDGKDFAGLLASNVPRFSRCQLSDCSEPLIIKGDYIGSEKSVLNRMISYPCDKPTVLNISGDKYILPAHCNFLKSDASNLRPLVNYAQCNGHYNLLVLDPPWFNKSAKRGSKYSFMSLWQIKSLPVPLLLAPGALVGIWVTNKQKYLRFTKTELFPHWSIELVAEWYWVKVTRKGELVTDLDSPHKKPYEPLLIGRFTQRMDGLGTSCLHITKDDKNSDKKMELTCIERGSSDIFLPPNKRKKINDDSDDDETRTQCTCDLSKNTAAATSLDWKQLSTSKRKSREITIHGHKHNEKGTQGPRKYCLNCQGLYHKNKVDMTNDDMNSSSNIVWREQTIQEVMGLQESSCLQTGTTLGVDFTKNLSNPKCGMSNTSEQSEPVWRDVTPEYCEMLPYHQIICSVPCKIHSRKPPLHEIFSQYVPPNSPCLEMFARNLTPHWTCWGNEVLKFQSMEYFEEYVVKTTQGKSS